ncbi:hypothetical protein Tco_1440610 [Tanacetum coccineum]
MLPVVIVITDCDETLTIQSNRSDRYASIVASEQRAELFGRIGMLERDNMRLRGMVGVERQRVERLRRSMSDAAKQKGIGAKPPGWRRPCELSYDH